jgi:hypothetical protein
VEVSGLHHALIVLLYCCCTYLQEIAVTEAARLRARKKRKKQGTLENPFFPKGELPIMADAIATALRRFGTVFQPHLYIDVRPYLIIKSLWQIALFRILTSKVCVNVSRC